VTTSGTIDIRLHGNVCPTSAQLDTLRKAFPRSGGDVMYGSVTLWGAPGDEEGAIYFEEGKRLFDDYEGHGHYLDKDGLYLIPASIRSTGYAHVSFEDMA
jgi:hypothetical protein